MAGKPGRSGTNKGLDKPWRDALALAVKRKGEDNRVMLARVAEAVVNAAIAGDMQAAKEIGDRLDGKARQEVEHSGEVSGGYVIMAPAVIPAADEWQQQHKPNGKMPH